jgi:hypothetical protein
MSGLRDRYRRWRARRAALAQPQQASPDCYGWLTVVAVLLVAGIAAVISYEHIWSLAVRYGQPRLAAYLLSLSIDGAVLTSSLATLRSARLAVTTPGVARGMLALSVGATLACNVAYGLPHGWPGALLSGWPAVAFIGSAEVAFSMSRRATWAPAIADASETTSNTASDAVRQPVTAAQPQPVTARPAAAAHHPVTSGDRRHSRRGNSKRSRRGGNLEERQAHRAALETQAVAVLAAELGIAELARRLDVSASTGQRILRQLSGPELAS